MKKVCATCGQAFEGRANKEYCSTACKSAVNNKRQAKKNSKVLEVEKILRRNRNILVKLYEVYREEPFTETQLKRLGLLPSFFTNQIDSTIFFL
jgi:predicted nucleic acid-binding Zn ribbon protein